ncbi:amidohydrolase family protein [Frateuria sp. YIM B11624]|uniref:amidohydrolase family protein n=1 Tax=Frateuria sp. YIM B11624 TaxID=3143185 RepID=UPI003C77A7E6
MTLRAVALRCLGILLLVLAPGAEALAGTSPGTPVVDHHTHLNAPAIQAFLPEFCAAVKRLGGCDPALTAAHSPADLLAAMDKAGIRRALVLSDGYLAQSPMMKPQRPDAAALMRAANDWTVALARRHPTRLAAFIAVDPLRPTALGEIARWRDDPAVRGVKLHLTASGVDLRNSRHLAALAGVFRAAAGARLAILVHLRTTRGDYGAGDVQRFLDAVLPSAGSAPVQIAHAAGWGGIDAPTLSALGAFADAFQAHPEHFRHVWFDLSGVWSGHGSASDRQALVVLMRRIGIRHFLPGSDWPYNGDSLAEYYGHGYPQLPLTQKEWAIIRANVAPYAKAR